MFVANSGDFADVKGTVRITVDCETVYKDNGVETDYNINQIYGGNNSAGEVLGNGAPTNITHPEIASYAGSAVTINIKNAIIYMLYGGSNKSDCNYVSNVLIEGGKIFHVYGGCNEADILGTAPNSPVNDIIAGLTYLVIVVVIVSCLPIQENYDNDHIRIPIKELVFPNIYF